jgi:hypothetical protein
MSSRPKIQALLFCQDTTGNLFSDIFKTNRKREKEVGE